MQFNAQITTKLVKKYSGNNLHEYKYNLIHAEIHRISWNSFPKSDNICDCIWETVPNRTFGISRNTTSVFTALYFFGA